MDKRIKMVFRIVNTRSIPNREIEFAKILIDTGTHASGFILPAIKVVQLDLVKYKESVSVDVDGRQNMYYVFEPVLIEVKFIRFEDGVTILKNCYVEVKTNATDYENVIRNIKLSMNELPVLKPPIKINKISIELPTSSLKRPEHLSFKFSPVQYRKFEKYHSTQAILGSTGICGLGIVIDSKNGCLEVKSEDLSED